MSMPFHRPTGCGSLNLNFEVLIDSMIGELVAFFVNVPKSRIEDLRVECISARSEHGSTASLRTCSSTAEC